MDYSRSPVQLTPPRSPEALQRHRLEIAHYKSELAAYTLRQWNIARLDAEKKETDRKRRRMHALAQYAAAGLTSPSSASAHSQAPPVLDGTAQYHHSAGGHILMTTRRESRRSFTASATTITPSSSHQHVHNYQPYHHAHQHHHQPHPPYNQYAQHPQSFEHAPSNSEHQRSCATNLHPSNTPTATMSAQLDHTKLPTHVLSDSNATSLSQSMSAMAIDPSYRHHTNHANEHEARPPSSGHWQPSQHTPHLRRASTSASAGRTAGSHLGTQLLSMTPFHHSQGKSSNSAITSDEDSSVEEPSTEGSSRTSSSSLSRKPRTPQAHDGLTPPFDALGYRPNHRHRASMPIPQRKAKEVRGAYVVGFNRNTTADLRGDGCGVADNVRHGGGSRAVA